jgi:hypothetical protein
LTDAQRAKICETKTILHCQKLVKVEFVNTTMMDPAEKTKRDAQQKVETNKLNNYANHVYGKCLVKNGIA